MNAIRPAPRHQRGAALLLAMMIVTLVSTLAISMVWQQWRAVQVETAERARAQSSWILSGALDWAGLILREDARPSSGRVDHLGEPWAVPLAEARLSTFLAADKQASTDDGPEAFLSGSITDAQARFNLRNLINDRGQLSPNDVLALQRLCEITNVSPSVATLIANGMRDAHAAPGADGASTADTPLRPKRVSQLRWFGVDEQALQRLEPYLVLLPNETTVNVNTAAREVIAAVIPGANIGDAERLVQHRQRTPFNDPQEIAAQLSGSTTPQALVRLGVQSRYFEVRGRLRLSDRVLEQRSLLEREQRTIKVLTMERVSTSERPG